MNEQILEYLLDKAGDKFNIFRGKDIIQGVERKYHPHAGLLCGYTKFELRSVDYLLDGETIELISNFEEYEVSLSNEEELRYKGENIILSNYGDIISNIVIARPSS